MPLRLIQLLLLLFLASCNNKDIKNFKNATPIFDNQNLEISANLSELEIKLPQQQNNIAWTGYNQNNLKIENFAFNPKINKFKNINFGLNSFKKNILSKPLIFDNKIYLLDTKGNLIAKNLLNGKKIWSKTIFDKENKRDFRGGKIFYSENIIYATSGFNYLAAINAGNGKLLWSKKIGSIPISTPITHKNQLFVITDDNKTYAINKNNGRINWIHNGINKNTAILGSADPIIYKNYLIISYSSGEIYLLDQKNGTSIWSHNLNINKAINSDFILNDIDATPIIKNDIIYSIGNGGLMSAIEINSGNIIWQKELSSISNFWIADNFIYLINNNNQLIALERLKGNIKWYNDLDKKEQKTIYYGVIMAGDNLILSNSNNEIILASPLDGQIIKRKKISGNIHHTPIIVNKKLYLSISGKFFFGITESH